jgi:hypothetical protein
VSIIMVETPRSYHPVPEVLQMVPLALVEKQRQPH